MTLAVRQTLSGAQLYVAPTCRHCGGGFVGPLALCGRRPGFCSYACNLAAKRKPQQRRFCARCLDAIPTGGMPNRVYCSDYCRERVQRARAARRRRGRSAVGYVPRLNRYGLAHSYTTRGEIRRAANKRFRVDRAEVLMRDGRHCYLCGAHVLTAGDSAHPRYATLDHVIPLARGGQHTYDNVKIACRECNTRKGARMPEGVAVG